MNALLDPFFSWLIHTSWEATGVVILVMGAQFLFKRWLPARWRYALWFLVVLRLVVPTLPHSPLSLHRFPNAVASVSHQPFLKAVEPLPPSGAVEKIKQPATIPNEPKSQWVSLDSRMGALLWLIGATGLAVATLVHAGRFAFALRRARACCDGPVLEIAQAAASELGLRRAVPIVTTPLVSGPAMVGIFRPTLLLPEGLLAAFSPDELRVVFLHEFAHLRRGDMMLNALLVVLQILHWFNPVLWFAFARMRHDRELATDALVLSEARASLKTLYGHTLLKLIEGFDSSLGSPRLVGIMENSKEIKDRLVRITQATPGAYRRSILGLTLLALIGVTALTQGIADPTTSVTAASGESKGSEKSKTPRRPDETDWYLTGTRLGADAVVALEKQVASEPSNLEARVKILGYYFMKRSLQESARAAAQPHILWIIRNLPDSVVAGSPEVHVDRITDPARYNEAKNAWDEQVAKQPNNPQILGNAAAFFLLNDSPLAEKLLRQAQALDSKNPIWAERLGQLFTLRAVRGDAAAKSDAHSKAFESLEAALADKKGEPRFYQLGTTAKAAFSAGNLAKAHAYAEELLGMASSFKSNWNYGNAIYMGNSILGLVALSQNDVKAARTYLLAASETPGSPQLNSFGPDMTLAQQLLERGEKETVLTFLGNISKFWKWPQNPIKDNPDISKLLKEHKNDKDIGDASKYLMSPEEKIKAWQETIRQGKIPQFDRVY
jgi:beta-lactamase regulating signal transducer with metallopeptidase domain/tetratricopeptide (TPR) repeat protein